MLQHAAAACIAEWVLLFISAVERLCNSQPFKIISKSVYSFDDLHGPVLGGRGMMQCSSMHPTLAAMHRPRQSPFHCMEAAESRDPNSRCKTVWSGRACVQVGCRWLFTRSGLGYFCLLSAGVPIPSEHAAAGSRIEEATQQALQEAVANGVQGHAITPFLLHRVQQLTGGASLAANIQLIKHNAAIGSRIACALQLQLQPA